MKDKISPSTRSDNALAGGANMSGEGTSERSTTCTAAPLFTTARTTATLLWKFNASSPIKAMLQLSMCGPTPTLKEWKPSVFEDSKFVPVRVSCKRRYVLLPYPPHSRTAKLPDPVIVISSLRMLSLPCTHHDCPR